MAEQLRIRFPSLADPALEHGFRFVHRLDYATSGCLAVALSKKAAKAAGESTLREAGAGGGRGGGLKGGAWSGGSARRPTSPC